jgi:hypothetical protein
MMGSGSSEYRKYGSHARVRRREQRFKTASRQLRMADGNPCDADERRRLLMFAGGYRVFERSGFQFA